MNRSAIRGSDYNAREVQLLRAGHNFAPETAIHDVAVALRKNIRESDLDGILAKLPSGARDFWRP